MYDFTIFVIFVAFLKACSCCCTEAKINYYETLIETNIEATNTYQVPVNNAEFEEGIQSTKTIDHGAYDFIIVGAGTAGSIIATRLTEIAKIRVLLLEAGGEQSDFTQIPFYSHYYIKSPYNWGYLTVPHNNSCLAMKNNSCSAPRGKGVGGSNLVNGMAYVRGNPADYDRWEAIGNPGWGSKGVFDYFLKSENSQIDGAPGWHGEDGLWNVEYNGPLSETVPYFIEANRAKGQRHLNDYNTADQIGVSRMQYNEKRGQRFTTAMAFLDNARQRKNCHVKINALVTKILIDGNRNAQGVEFVADNKKYTARATKEVILSGGAYNSPHLLMLSGIGPREELERHNIKVIADLPVGKNLIEHPYFLGLTYLTNVTYSPGPLPDQIRDYLQGTGPLTIPFNMHAIGFLPPKNGSNTFPLTEYIFEPLNGTSSIFYDISNFQDKYTEEFLLDAPYTILGVYIALLHENSRGSVTLKSSNPLDFPNIDYNLFSDKNNDDIKNFIHAIRFLNDLMESEPMKRINATFLAPSFCREEKQFSDAYWECMLRYMTITVYHPLGTAAMGPRSKSVVDPSLKVYGVGKLRVVDASVMPASLSGHTNAPTAMVAEKGSDIIKNDYGYYTKKCVTTNA